jgi:hypothetical protein
VLAAAGGDQPRAATITTVHVGSPVKYGTLSIREHRFHAGTPCDAMINRSTQYTTM